MFLLVFTKKFMRTFQGFLLSPSYKWLSGTWFSWEAKSPIYTILILYLHIRPLWFFIYTLAPHLLVIYILTPHFPFIFTLTQNIFFILTLAHLKSFLILFHPFLLIRVFFGFNHLFQGLIVSKSTIGLF